MRKIDEVTKANAGELARAMRNGKTALVDCLDTRTNTPVVVLCAVNRLEAGDVELVPFAIMLDGNPFDYLRPPAIEGTGYAEADEGSVENPYATKKARRLH